MNCVTPRPSERHGSAVNTASRLLQGAVSLTHTHTHTHTPALSMRLLPGVAKTWLRRGVVLAGNAHVQLHWNEFSATWPRTRRATVQAPTDTSACEAAFTLSALLTYSSETTQRRDTRRLVQGRDVRCVALDA